MVESRCSAVSMLRAVITALVVGLLVGGYFFLYTPAEPLPESSTEISLQKTEKTSAPRVAPLGSRLYESVRYRFSLLYPEALSVREYDEGAGAITITFQDVKSGTGFQLFIVPYSMDQVTDERFKKDIPSGVRENVTAVSVDGAVGAAFDSEHQLLGPTREIWFVKNGFLYEVTTHRDLASLLPTIMTTWKFI